MEKVDIKKVIYQAKVAGTMITVGGAMLMTLYKGPLVEMAWTEHRQSRGGGGGGGSTSSRDWFIGCIVLIIATLAWASFFILQKAALKTYSNHQLSLTSMVCFMGTIQAIAVTLVMEHDASVWGTVTSSISYYVQGLVMKKKGPVFATAFSPLMMIIVAIMGSFILAEKIYLGGVIGSVIIVIGLYSVLWGKYKEEREEKTKLEELPEAVKDDINGMHTTFVVAENNEDDDDKTAKDVTINVLPLSSSTLTT
ncbi:nodulin MtN21 /EamA-like transporter family protein [Perilla frutescens var. frutescens]|nr:nodulin MtN21 /EamA-like transporter family protein [Perilla frutescens var. frutescens]